MEILNKEQLSFVSGGDYLLTLKMEAPGNNVGTTLGFFIGRLIQGQVRQNSDFITYYNSFLSISPYAPGVHITSIDFAPI